MTVVRRATLDDAAAIGHVHVASWRVAYASLGEEFLATLDGEERTGLWARVLGSDDASETFVAVVDDAVVAFVNVRSSRDEGAPPTTGEVVALYAAPHAWGTGAGRALMAAAVDELRVLGFSEANLWVLDTNTRARRFYERAGWVADGVEKDEVWRGALIHEVRYTRTL
jgi:GNAT superfamily N-acetyltransferase